MLFITMQIIRQLINFGLSEKEAQVYLALLRLGISIVHEITETTGLNRSSIYVVLNSLQKRGLVNIVSNLGVTKYIAAAPDQILNQAKNNVLKYVLLKQNLNTILPELQVIHKGGAFKPKITILEGKKGLIEYFENNLEIKDKVARISSNLAIFGNTIGLMASTDLFAIKIESNDMANTVKTIFDLALQETKRLQKKLQII